MSMFRSELLMKKIIAILLTLTMLIGVMFSAVSVPVSAVTSEFYFNGSMSKEVLRNYVSRAVTQEDLVISNCFDEDMRMLRRIGAKFIGRTTLTSWIGAITSKAKLDDHYNAAEEKLAKAHALDPEMIFQAGIFEIVFEHSVECLPIPAYVFEAFDQPVVSRNFEFDNIAFPKGTVDKNGNDTGVGCWSTAATSGVPDITQLETKMYFYYLITRYIDVGFEAIHMGQAEKMMLYKGNSYAYHWDELLSKARTYAKTHARRGVILFDYHNAIDSGGIKVDDRLIFDIQGAALVPSETVIEDNAMKCEVTAPSGSHWLSWVGRSAGGTHPLGFTVENNFTILEFDNYGNSGTPGAATYESFMNWGFDDITWFALQPEEYRNQFLKETDAYLKSHCLDSAGNQQYFLQPACKRNLTITKGFIPNVLYTPGEKFNSSYLATYAKSENSTYQYSSTQNGYIVYVEREYRANKNSDACPNGFNQEDTIPEIFLGKNAPEDPTLQQVTLPSGYSAEETYTKEFTVRTRQSDVISSTDKVMADIAKVMQGYKIDIYAPYRPAGEPLDYAHWGLEHGNYMVLELEVNANASSLKLQNLDFDSCQGFKFELSADNEKFYTMVDFGDSVGNSELEAAIEPQYFTNRGATAYVLNKASKRNGKKVVYLKISTYSGTGIMRIKSFDVATTRGVSIPLTSNGKQQFYADTACRSDYSPNAASPNYFEKFVVKDKSKYATLYWTVKLDATYPNIVLKFDLADTTTSFIPYLYASDSSSANIKIEASKNGSTWYEIVSSTVVGPYGTYGEIGQYNWSNLNIDNVQKVLSSNSTKTVYLRYSFVSPVVGTEVHLQHLGLTSTYSIDMATYDANNGHIPGAAATCTTAQYCTICNAQITAAGHKSGEVVVENKKAPTATKQGSYDNVVYCTECGEELSRETVTVIYADCDGNKVCNILDLIALKKAILDNKGYSLGSDLHYDNVINSLDLIAIKKYLFEAL